MRLLTDNDLYEKIEEETHGMCGGIEDAFGIQYFFEQIVDNTKGIDFNSILDSLSRGISFAYKKSQDSPRPDFYAGYIEGIEFTIATAKKALETNNLKEVD